MERNIVEWVDANSATFINLSREIHAHPELSGEEHRAAALHVRLLREMGFLVEQPFLDLDTAFRAVYDSGRPGPCVAYLAEYDALPEIGHGCGHNLLGAVSTFAGLALSRAVSQTGGRVIVLGCPAEETAGAKVQMAEQGVFDRVDVAMLAHPYHRFQESGSSTALQALRFAFFGKVAHAADVLNAGINALDGVLALFRYVDKIKENKSNHITINGVIPHGGTVANVIPGYAAAEFHLRGHSGIALDEVAKNMENEAERIAAKIGAKVNISHYEPTYENMVTNKMLSKVFNVCLRQAGQEEIAPAENSPFSLDMGNVSQVCPSIHPYFGICKGEKVDLHTEKFCSCADQEYAHQQGLITAKALALTGLRVMQDKELLVEIKKEFQSMKQCNA